MDDHPEDVLSIISFHIQRLCPRACSRTFHAYITANNPTQLSLRVLVPNSTQVLKFPHARRLVPRFSHFYLHFTDMLCHLRTAASESLCASCHPLILDSIFWRSHEWYVLCPPSLTHTSHRPNITINFARKPATYFNSISLGLVSRQTQFWWVLDLSPD